MVCNSGTSLVPVVDGQARHFNFVGIYDGLFMMQDVETKSLWNHITGDAQYGPAVGMSLEASNLIQTTVEQALRMDARTQVAISEHAYLLGDRRVGPEAGPGDGSRGAKRMSPANPDAALGQLFIDNLGVEDTRLPQMAMGLGLVEAGVARFYPKDVLDANGPLIDDVGGRRVLLFVDPSTFTPTAIFTDASTVRGDTSEIRLDNGRRVRDGLLFDANGARVDMERPQQLFSRWYGFALTFPRTQIYGQ